MSSSTTKTTPHERRLHQPGPEQAIGDGVAMAASMPSLSRVASRLLASNQSLASNSRVLNTASSTTLGTSRMLLMRLPAGSTA